jgi:hypothetical protein
MKIVKKYTKNITKLCFVEDLDVISEDTTVRFGTYNYTVYGLRSKCNSFYTKITDQTECERRGVPMPNAQPSNLLCSTVGRTIYVKGRSSVLHLGSTRTVLCWHFRTIYGD